VELTPRTLDDDAIRRTPPRRRRRRWLPLMVLTLVVAGIGVLVFKGLSDATLYFRLQGTVTGHPTEVNGTVSFAVTYNGVSVDVHHVGSPPELFKPGIPVVLEGHWDRSSDVFDSDRILIKHDATYESKADYEKRIREAREGGTVPAGGAG
jgi:cytochrome c-type biogenesis protein CcmE